MNDLLFDSLQRIFRCNGFDCEEDKDSVNYDVRCETENQEEEEVVVDALANLNPGRQLVFPRSYPGIYNDTQ